MNITIITDKQSTLFVDGNLYMRYIDSWNDVNWAVYNKMDNRRFSMGYCDIRYNENVVKNQRTEQELENMYKNYFRKEKLQKIINGSR